ncbi:MAG: NUDIX hydrolase [Rhodobacteraceae bacterium]|nr:NUDIX hydrolase [Paracoccaceae bacterium]
MESGSGTEFDGAKIAVLMGDRVLCLLRDDRPGLSDPGLWDLPGGGREGDETVEATALRELHEELGLRLDPARIFHRRFYVAPRPAWFLAADWPDLDPAAVRLGSEGQGWALMPVEEFLSRRDVVARFQTRLREALAARA